MAIVDKKNQIKKSGSAMTSAISQLVQISGQSDNPSGRKTVTDRQTETQTETQKDRNTEKQKHRHT